jgi:hypothetical protein
LDLKQFYPSTTAAMVRNFFVNDLGMYDDVAALLTRLSTIDEKVSFGSPLTPVLCALVHRQMFDAVAELCGRHGLNYSVWVDDLTISGANIPRALVTEMRTIVQSHGLKTHRIKYRWGSKPVFITGIGIIGDKLVAPNSLNLKIKELWSEYDLALTPDEVEACSLCLLSHLGTIRHISGPSSVAGRKAADSMNMLRQKREKLRRKKRGSAKSSPPVQAVSNVSDDLAPFE